MKKLKKGISIIISLIGVVVLAYYGVTNYLFTEEGYNVTFENYELGIKPDNLTNIYELPTEMPVLKQEGYEFIGWYYDESFVVEALPNDILIEDVILYAKWLELKFDVTFNNNGFGDFIQGINDIKKLPELPILEAKGYTFGGWYYESDYNTLAKKDDVLTKDVTLYAKWEETVYTIYYNDYQHSGITSIKNKGDKILELPNLTVDGYTFDGWYYESNYNTKAKIGDVVESDITLFASWIANKYTVSFDYQIVDSEISKINTKYEEEITLLNSVENIGYAFIGWNTKADGTGISYKANDKIKNLSTGKDITLYAIWEPIEYTLTVNLNNGQNNIIKKLHYNDLIEVIENPTKQGYVFAGWYSNGEKFSFENAKMPNSNLVIEARYLKESEITFISFGTIHCKLKGHEGLDIIEVVEDPVRLGYKFIGWYLDSDFKQEFNLTNFPSDNINVYAKFEIVNYTVSFDLNGVEGKIDSISTTINDKVQLPQCEIERTGYEFVSWNTKADGTGIDYLETTIIKKINNDLVLYAIWEQIDYTLIINLNNGEDNIVKILHYNDDIQIEEEPTKDGYIFNGWYLNGEQYDLENAKMPNSNLLLEAKYLKEVHLVFIVDNTIFDTIQGYETLQIPSEVNTPEKIGYQFEGWYLDADFKQEFNLTLFPANDINAYAKFKSIDYTLSFDLNGVEGEINSINISYTDEVRIPECEFTKIGYQFICWNTKSDGTGVVYYENSILKKVSNDIKLYAIWEQIEYTLTVNLNNGEDNIVKVLYYNDVVEMIENPVKENAEFNGWFTYVNGEMVEYNFENAKMPNDDLTIFASYKGEVTIAFMVDGKPNTTITGIENTNINVDIQEPSKSGYEFIGWYLDSDFKQEFNLNKYPNSNINVYAKFEAIKYLLSFNLNGGTGSLEEINFTYEDEIEIPSCSVNRLGYNFVCWNTKIDGSGIDYNASSIIKNKSEDITLYAIWEQIEYTLTVNLNNGQNNIIKILHYNDDIETIEEPTKNSFKFIGWYVNDVVFSFDNAKMPNSNLLIEARYIKEVNIVFGTVDYIYDVISGYETLEIKETVEDPVKEGYTFDGWYLDSNFKQEFNLTVFPSEDIKVYAKFNVNTVIIKYDGNGNTSGMMTSQNIIFGSNTSLSKNIFEKTGHTFIGWAKEKDSTEVDFIDQYNKDIISEGEITLYAVWEVNEYTLTIKLNNGQSDIILEVAYNENIVPVVDPYKTGYKFNGWYVGIEQFSFDNAKMPANNLVIVAKYLKEVKIDFIIDNEVFDSLKGYETLEITDKIKEYQKTGYTFIGWYLDAEFNQEYNLTTFPSNNIRVFAKIEANKVLIKFDGNGSTSGSMENQEITYGSGISLDKNGFIKSGYNFKGWSTNKNSKDVQFIDEYNKDIISEGEITLYAVWEEITYTVTFNNNGHGQNPNKVEGVTSLPSKLEILIEEGYIFVGWYYDVEFTVSANVNDKLYSDVTLYAKWEKEVTPPTPTPEPTEKIVDDIIYDDLKIYFLELGNGNSGDSVYITAGEVDILIDAGSKRNSTDTLISQINKYRTDGDEVLDYVIATHAHEDHIAGFVGSDKDDKDGILYEYKIGTIIDFAKKKTTSAVSKEYIKCRDDIVANYGTKHYTADQCFNETNGASRVYQLTEDISFEILYNHYYFNSGDENDYSVCLMINYNDLHFMFTGDLEESGEKKMAQYYDGSTPEKTLPHVELFKAGHHGSPTSSNDCLLSKIQPEIVCVCCCAGGTEYTTNYQNTFPGQDVIDRIAKYTDRMYATTAYNISKGTHEALNGVIIISSNGVNVGIEDTVSGSTGKIKKIKDSEWFNTTIYAKSDGTYYADKKYYTSATPGVTAVPQRVWPSK